ncbi:hypothetical protein OU994_10390 [Pseudoduganella sp. SL102]|uniref:AbiU2 domain-containing protein n=1 Tax=Pseudoduganella sp. SL102 TaxID=2995154 RepID=UPI00248B522D|nr:hypothetical protein [Pseudoduganella sp. SL102]WBS04649.1 hypothetical protein OU994_10390 [Pseudoduganella sp. SL102]
MNPASLAARVAKLDAHASRLLDAFLILRERYAMLHPMLFDERVPAGYGSGQRTWGYQILRHSLFLSCCQDIAKLVMDDYERTPSIRKLVASLVNDDVRSTLKAQFCDVSPAVMRQEPDEGLAALLRDMDAREALERGVEFDRHYSDLVSAWDRLSVSATVKGFVTIRDKVSAHNEIQYRDDAYVFFDVASAGIAWGDLNRTIREMQHVVELLGLVIRGAGFAWEALDGQLQRAAAGFWCTEG